MSLNNNDVPTIPSPSSNNIGPALSPPNGSGGGSGRALSSKNTAKPQGSFEDPGVPLLLPPVAVDDDVPTAEILGVYTRDKNGNPVPARGDDGKPLPLPPGVAPGIAPGALPGVIPLPGSDLPPLPEKNKAPKRNVPFRPDLTA